jgi:hypothetical protein
MKNSVYFKLTFTFILLSTLISCVKNDEYEVPQIEAEAANIDLSLVITMNALANEFEQALFAEALDLGIDPNDSNAINTLRQSFKFTFGDNLRYIEGYVISDDSSGNFFEELILQDHPSAPKIGVKLLLDSNPLYITYQLGRKVFIRIDGLTMGYNSGVLSLGLRSGTNLEKIGESQMVKYLVRDSVVATLEPLPLDISEFSVSKTNLYVRLADVQFSRFDVLGDNPKTFAAEATDEFDGERNLEECSTGNTAVFSTSTFAKFKASILPNGRGALDGILTLNFFGDTFNVMVNDPSTISFDETERCDPAEIDCGLADDIGPNVLFSDYFENQSTGDPISGNGWTNYIEEGTETWEAFYRETGSVSLGISANIGSFGSGDNRSIGWLITPQINFDAQERETLRFKTSNSFADGSRLESLFSSNWDGIPENIPFATWDVLSAAYIAQNDDDFVAWFSSGKVDLSCITGSGYIAWKYVGSGEQGFDGTYELDEIEIDAD